MPALRGAALRLLVERVGSALGVFAASRAERSAIGLPGEVCRALAAADWAGAEADLRWAGAPGRSLLWFDDPLYPPQLAQIPDPPPLLFVAGDVALLGRPQLAVVGSRNPSPSGRELAREFASQLAEAGLVVTSGLAEGIDGAAHQGALEAGRTVAVMGTGPDRVYPRCHAALAERIAREGALVSEFPTGTPPRAAHFPRRNRVVTGLSRGLLVVEAALRSGSLVSARLAGEQGREVFAVPGSIRNPLSRGCHALIRDGAKLVEQVEDVLEELGDWRPLPRPAAARQAAPGPEAGPESLGLDYLKLLNAMDCSPATLDQLALRSGLTPPVLSSMLLVLELQGAISALAGGRFARRAGRS